MLSGGGGMSDEGVGLSCQPVTGPEQLLLTGTLFLSAQGGLFSHVTLYYPLYSIVCSVMDTGFTSPSQL